MPHATNFSYDIGLRGVASIVAGKPDRISLAVWTRVATGIYACALMNDLFGRRRYHVLLAMHHKRFKHLAGIRKCRSVN